MLLSDMMSSADMTADGAECENERATERVFLSVLQSLVLMGAITHRYNSKKKRDEFTCTDKLFEQVCPGEVRDPSRVEWHGMRINGSRSQHFPEGWAEPDEDDPPPMWPEWPERLC